MLARLTAFNAMILIAASGAMLAIGSLEDRVTPSEATRSPVKKAPVSYTPPSSGKEMYLAYCASCHGKDGRGDGPAASALKSAPADLTQLTLKNGSKFPEGHVAQTIRGDSNTISHGSKDMPVWGPIFRALGTKSDGVVQLRILNLTNYIASLQEK